MNKSTEYIHHFKTLTSLFDSCSVVNADGQLLYSKDAERPVLTTTRLVAFQLIKKYLRPQPLDFFILNDPENGGFNYQTPLFVAAITPNLFLIWNTSIPLIDYKIPPTPLYDKGVKNDFIWQAMVSAHPRADLLAPLLLSQKSKFDQILNLKQVIDSLSLAKNQQNWLKMGQEVFKILFSSKAFSNHEASHRFGPTQTFKLKITAEEKQNIQQISLDLSHTSLAQEISAASHVIESALIKKIADYYELGDFLNQSTLDKVKISLPPRSIASNPHALGLHNYELQSLASQICNHLLIQMNTPSRKNSAIFEYKNFLYLRIDDSELQNIEIFCSNNSCEFKTIELLLEQQKIKLHKMRRQDQSGGIEFTVTDKSGLKINLFNSQLMEGSSINMSVNSLAAAFKNHRLDLKLNDHVSIHWSF